MKSKNDNTVFSVDQPRHCHQRALALLLLVFSCFLAQSTCFAAKPLTIAVLSTSEQDGDVGAVMDLLELKLSNGIGFQVVERRLFDELLKEQKLSATLGSSAGVVQLGKLLRADLLLFAGEVKTADGAASGRFRLCETRQGIRLLDRTITAGDIDAMAAGITPIVKAKSAILGDGKALKLISLLGVSNGGMSRADDSYIPLLRHLIERDIVDHSSLVLTERDRLIEILREHHLANQTDALRPSATFLSVSIRPKQAANSEHLLLSFKLTDNAGKNLAEPIVMNTAKADLLAAAQLGLRRVLGEVAELTPVAVTLADEIARLKQESIVLDRLGHLGQSARFARAGFLLDPRSTDIELLRLGDRNDLNSEQFLEHARWVEEMMRRTPSGPHAFRYAGRGALQCDKGHALHLLGNGPSRVSNSAPHHREIQFLRSLASDERERLARAARSWHNARHRLLNNLPVNDGIDYPAPTWCYKDLKTALASVKTAIISGHVEAYVPLLADRPSKAGQKALDEFLLWLTHRGPDLITMKAANRLLTYGRYRHLNDELQPEFDALCRRYAAAVATIPYNNLYQYRFSTATYSPRHQNGYRAIVDAYLKRNSPVCPQYAWGDRDAGIFEAFAAHYEPLVRQQLKDESISKREREQLSGFLATLAVYRARRTEKKHGAIVSRDRVIGLTKRFAYSAALRSQLAERWRDDSVVVSWVGNENGHLIAAINRYFLVFPPALEGEPKLFRRDSEQFYHFPAVAIDDKQLYLRENNSLSRLSGASAVPIPLKVPFKGSRSHSLSMHGKLVLHNDMLWMNLDTERKGHCLATFSKTGRRIGSAMGGQWFADAFGDSRANPFSLRDLQRDPNTKSLWGLNLIDLPDHARGKNWRAYGDSSLWEWVDGTDAPVQRVTFLPFSNQGKGFRILPDGAVLGWANSNKCLYLYKDGTLDCLTGKRPHMVFSKPEAIKLRWPAAHDALGSFSDSFDPVYHHGSLFVAIHSTNSWHMINDDYPKGVELPALKRMRTTHHHSQHNLPYLISAGDHLYAVAPDGIYEITIPETRP